MLFKRKIYNKFLAWKQEANGQKALLVEGARRIGKSTVVEEFAKNEYKSYILIDFAKAPENVKSYFQLHLNDLDTFYMLLSVQYGVQLYPRESAIIFDEVQLFPKAREAIKYLVADGRYDFLETGSLISIKENVKDIVIPSEERHLKMYPLDFEEFCWSQNVDGKIFDMLKECYEKKHPVDDFIHEHLMSLFRKYLIIGGMPAAVASFAQNNSLIDVRQAQEDIKQGYRRDISQYARKEDRLHIRSIYDLVPSELNNPNKRFTFAKIEKNTRFQAVANDFDWLAAANVAIPAYNVDEPRKPLEMSKERNLFKLFYSDVGLLTSAYLNSTALDILAGDDEVNYGAIYENVVAQELTAHGFSHLYYYNSKRLGELDFLVQDLNDNIIPIEVKSGKNYKVHRALNNVLAEESYHLHQGLVFGPGNIETNNNITYYPIYLIGQFCNN